MRHRSHDHDPPRASERDGGKRSRPVALTAVFVWCVLVAAIVPGVVAGATATTAGVDVRTEVATADGDSVTATATPGVVAAGVGDAVELSGQTAFDTGEVRLYLVGPRGTFLDSDGSSEEMETEQVSVGAFAATYEAFPRRGVYRLLVVSPRADGAFETTETLGRDALPGGVTQRQAVDMVRAAYGRDEVVELSLRGETPALGIDPISADGAVPQGEGVTVSGTTNRGDGTTVFVDLVDRNGRVVTNVEATVDASTGTWEADVDLSSLEQGSYTVFADDTASTASATLIVVDDTATPMETPADTPIPDDSDSVEASETTDNATGAALANATDGLETANETTDGATGADENGAGGENASVNGTTNGSANGTTNGTAEGGGSTGGQVPGFGVSAAVTALVVSLVVVRWRALE